ncbi:MAG: DinB family protein [Blastocatellia bacterium]
MRAKPEIDEYASYYGKYISLIDDDDIVAALEGQLDATVACLRGLSEEQGHSSYEPGKWSIKELVGHINDGERIFGYRALRIGRGDKTPLPGFEQDDYIAGANFNAQTLADLTTEFELIRRSNLAMFKQFSDEAWVRCGTASDNAISVRALAYIVAGHEVHHMNILRSRYL